MFNNSSCHLERENRCKRYLTKIFKLLFLHEIRMMFDKGWSDIYMVFRYFGFIFEIVGRKIGIPRIIALLKLFAFPSGVKWRALTSKRGGRKTFFFHSPSHANFYLLWDFSRVKLVMKSMNFRIFLQIRIYFIIIIFLKSL